MDIDRLRQLLSDQVTQQLSLFDSLWPGYAEEENTTVPHRQRTAVNRLSGYALFLGIDTRRKNAESAPLRDLRAWQKHIGPLRDLDVSREWIGRCLDRRPAAQEAARLMDLSLAGERRALLERIRPDSLGLPGASARIAHARVQEQFGRLLAAFGTDAHPFSPADALAAVAEPWIQRRDILRESHGNTLLHSFRVANKRLRFVVDELAEAGTGPTRDRMAERAAVLAEVHTAIGNLSDLWVLRERMLLFRSGHVAAAGAVHADFDAMEDARAEFERENFSAWFTLWPRLLDPGFLDFAA